MSDEKRQALDVPTLWSGFYEPGMPDLLLDMRVVQEWPIVPNPCPTDEVRLNGLRAMYDRDYLKFLDRIEKLESDWMKLQTAKLEASRPNVPSEWNGKGTCPTCKREAVKRLSEDECVGKVEGWMRKQPGVE